MRFVTVVLILLTAMVTQSCRITMPSLVELITSYDGRAIEDNGKLISFEKESSPYSKEGFNPYKLSKSSEGTNRLERHTGHR